VSKDIDHLGTAALEIFQRKVPKLMTEAYLEATDNPEPIDPFFVRGIAHMIVDGYTEQ
jgi:hypothetical protein